MDINIKPIALTMGDPSGISSEIVFKSWFQRKHKSIPPFFLIDDVYRLSVILKKMKKKIPIKKISDVNDVNQLFKSCLPVLQIDAQVNAKLGQPHFSHCKHVLESINKSVDLACDQKVRAIVTNPVCKKMLIKYGFKYKGQTEYISKLVSKKFKRKYDELMILSTTCNLKKTNLIVGLVTTHIPIRDVSKNLTKEVIIKKANSFYNSLRDIWKINNPVIGVCGLNPHGGEDGLLGSEEKKHIIPAIKFLKKKQIRIEGPLSPDSTFTNFNITKFDGILCMYHDQALIPVKTIDFYNSVNITGGLPILRVSPDHGPAFDISNKFIAKNYSLIAALKLVKNYS